MSEGLCDLFVGEEIQEGGLLKLGSKALAQGAVENGFACCVGEFGEDNGVFVGEFGGAGGAQVETGGTGDDSDCYDDSEEARTVGCGAIALVRHVRGDGRT